MPLFRQQLFTSLLQQRAPQSQPVYLVGGPVRDHLLRVESADYDFALAGAGEFARRFAAEHRLAAVTLDDTPGRETVRVILSPGVDLDFSELQGASIEEDLSQRDFTINAMAWPLADFLAGRENIIDPFGGRRDLARRAIRQVTPAALEADPLRMLRGFRFAALLGFAITKETLATITASARLIARSAGERIRHELFLFLAAEGLSPLLKSMAETGLLDALFPEWRDAREKTLALFDALEGLPGKQAHSGDPACGLAGREKMLIKCAALFFHASPGPAAGKKARPPENPALGRLKMSNADAGFVSDVLKAARHAQATRLAFACGEPSLTYRYVADSGMAVKAALVLARAAVQAEAGDAGEFAKAVTAVMDFYLNRYLPAKNEPPLLSGDDLIETFGLSPSPLFRRLLDQVEEGRVLGKLKTRADALALVKSLLAKS